MRRLVFAFSLLATPALAVDMTTVIHDQHGKPVTDTSQASAEDPTCKQCTSLTLGSVVAAALLADRKEENLSAIEKAKRGVLAMKVATGKDVSLNAKETADIVRLLSVWPPLVVSQAIPLIDPNQDIDPGK